MANRKPHPQATEYVVRTRKHDTFRRVGRTFTLEPTRVDASELTEAQRAFLLNGDGMSANPLIVEEIVGGKPFEPKSEAEMQATQPMGTQAPAEPETEEEEGEPDEHGTRRRRRRS